MAKMNGAFSAAVDCPAGVALRSTRRASASVLARLVPFVRFSPGKYVIVRLGWRPYTCRR